MTAEDLGRPELLTHVPPGLAELWIAVTRAGGAAGFTLDTPESVIVDSAATAAAEVTAGRDHLIAVRTGEWLVGTAFLRPAAGERHGHRGTVKALMVHPDLQQRGLGAVLLTAVADHARSVGLEQLILACRGGTGLPEYYTRRGWTEVGRVPRGLRFADGTYRDQYWFQFLLG